MENMFFLSGAPLTNKKIAQAAFFQGLYNKTNNIEKTMEYVDATDDDIEEKARLSLYDVVYVIKIPKTFLIPEMIGDKLKQAPLPIWKKVDGRYYLTNELIYGIYFRENDEFIYNDNYRNIHNPMGLLFDVGQDEYFRDNNLTVWSNFSMKRRRMDFTSLINYDLDNSAWDKILLRYEKYFKESNLKK